MDSPVLFRKFLVLNPFPYLLSLSPPFPSQIEDLSQQVHKAAAEKFKVPLEPSPLIPDVTPSLTIKEESEEEEVGSNVCNSALSPLYHYYRCYHLSCHSCHCASFPHLIDIR